MGNRYHKSTSDPLISVIIPTYNRKWLVGRAIMSVLQQSYKNTEILLVNDAGEDVQEVVDKINDPRVRYFKNETNKGLAGTRNVALSNARGEYICLLDDDDIYLPYTLEFRMYMMKTLGAEIVYTRALYDIWEKTQEGYISVGKTLYWDSPFDEDLILIQNVAPCCCPLFSLKSWRDSNYYKFDETMTTTEDHDFWIALSRHNTFHELKLVDCECSYRKDKTQMSGTLNFVPNWIKTFKKWRNTAKNLKYVTDAQNDILRRAGINPSDYGL